MIVKCTTLEQVNKIVEVEGWVGWQHTDYKGCLNYINKFGYVCVKITYEGEYGILDSWNECSNNEFIDFVDSKYFNNTIPVNEINQTVQCSWQDERLEVSLKIQPDGKTVVAECTHIAEELRGRGVLASKDRYKLRSDYGLSISTDSLLLYVRGEDKSRDFLVSSSIFNTPQEAQEYVKIMNELIDEINNPKIDWSKVEEGTEVTLNYELVYNSLVEVKIKANFHNYIPKLNKVVVIIDDEVKVVDEDKVELV